MGLQKTFMKAGGAALKSLFGRELSRIPTSRDGQWNNWSGRLNCRPQDIARPRDLDQLSHILKNTNSTVRPAGSGHSFSALVPTDGIIMDLSHFSGIISGDPATKQATIHAGTKLHALGDPLHAAGQALQNMGDIDRQSLAGATATGTHGTGAALGSLSSFVTGLEIVTARGDALWCDPSHNPDVFYAAQVNLGALGIVTKIRMQNRDPFRLERRTWVEPLDDLLDNLDNLALNNRNMEIFYFPHSTKGAIITHNETDKADTLRAAEDVDPLVLAAAIDRVAGWSKNLHQRALDGAFSLFDPEIERDQSYKLYPSAREARFNEMEYHIPRECGADALREIRDTIRREKIDIYFPIEFRMVAGDDGWISPFYKRPSCSIAVHQVAGRDHRPYFERMEKILRKYDGRPHWGKQHGLNAADLAALYPRWNDFQAVREAMDPGGRFLNAHLRRIFTASESARSCPSTDRRGDNARADQPRPRL